MIARITRVLILLQIAVAISLFSLAVKVWRIDNLWLASILSIGTVCLFRILITASNFCFAWIHRSETPLKHRIDTRQALHLFKEEFKASMLVSSWSMPFRTFHIRAIKNSTGLPVLLLHGYLCNSGYWDTMSNALMRANISHHAIDLEPVFSDIDGYVPILHRAVETLCQDTGQQEIIVVAHSMGGLAARAYLRVHGCKRIAMVITLGTPHHGTCLANSAAGLNSRQMHWIGSARNGRPSDWLSDLAKTENQAVRARFVSLYSHHDNIIAPQTSAHLPGATNIEFHGIGHVNLASNPQIQACVLEQILLASQRLTTPRPHA